MSNLPLKFEEEESSNKNYNPESLTVELVPGDETLVSF